jgi:hypothetical protein
MSENLCYWCNEAVLSTDACEEILCIEEGYGTTSEDTDEAIRILKAGGLLPRDNYDPAEPGACDEFLLPEKCSVELVHAECYDGMYEDFTTMGGYMSPGAYKRGTNEIIPEKEHELYGTGEIGCNCAGCREWCNNKETL